MALTRLNLILILGAILLAVLLVVPHVEGEASACDYACEDKYHSCKKVPGIRETDSTVCSSLCS